MLVTRYHKYMCVLFVFKMCEEGEMCVRVCVRVGFSSVYYPRDKEVGWGE